jgi:predicted lactoylglutathione lyase
MIRLDAVAVSSKDMTKTVAFYELLGFDFPE